MQHGIVTGQLERLAARRGVKIVEVENLERHDRLGGMKIPARDRKEDVVGYTMVCGNTPKKIFIESDPFNYLLPVIKPDRIVFPTSRTTTLKHELIHALDPAMSERRVENLETLPEHEIIRRLGFGRR